MFQSIWNINQIPDLKDKVIIVTSATSGLGKEVKQPLNESDKIIDKNLVYFVHYERKTHIHEIRKAGNIKRSQRTRGKGYFR